MSVPDPQVLEKIRKLLRTGQDTAGATDAERDTALAMAQKLAMRHGVSSWELDAIPPLELAALREQQILSLMDRAAWDRAVDAQNRERDRLQDIVEELRQ